MFGNRGIYHDGWTAVTRHSIPWDAGAAAARRSTTTSGSCTTPNDWTQAHDLAAEMPEKLAELQRLFLIEAGEYNVLPLDDRRVERMNPDLAGRPQLIKGNTQVLFPGMAGWARTRSSTSRTSRTPSPPTSTFPDGGATGVIVAQGGNFGGWAIYAHEGKLKYFYNFLGLELYEVEGGRGAARRRASGAPGVRLRRRRAGQGRHGHALPRRQEVGEGRVDATVPMLFSADETTDVGGDTATPVSDDYDDDDNAFTGRVRWVADRPRRRRRGRRPPDLRRGALPGRDEPAVAKLYGAGALRPGAEL